MPSDVEFNGNEISAEIRAAIDAALVEAADFAVSDVKTSLSEPYPASDPGQAPHTRTGDLIAAVGRDGVNNHSIDVFVDSPYAAALEYGSPSHKLAPRPFWNDAMEKLGAEIEEIYDRHLAKI